MHRISPRLPTLPVKPDSPDEALPPRGSQHLRHVEALATAISHVINAPLSVRCADIDVRPDRPPGARGREWMIHLADANHARGATHGDAWLTLVVVSSDRQRMAVHAGSVPWSRAVLRAGAMIDGLQHAPREVHEFMPVTLPLAGLVAQLGNPAVQCPLPSLSDEAMARFASDVGDALGKHGGLSCAAGIPTAHDDDASMAVDAIVPTVDESAADVLARILPPACFDPTSPAVLRPLDLARFTRQAIVAGVIRDTYALGDALGIDYDPLRYYLLTDGRVRTSNDRSALLIREIETPWRGRAFCLRDFDAWDAWLNGCPPEALRHAASTKAFAGLLGIDSVHFKSMHQHRHWRLLHITSEAQKRGPSESTLGLHYRQLRYEIALPHRPPLHLLINKRRR